MNIYVIVNADGLFYNGELSNGQPVFVDNHNELVLEMDEEELAIELEGLNLPEGARAVPTSEINNY